MIPLWAILGLSAALLSTAIPLIQERMRADEFAVAVWVKVAAVVLSAPFVVYYGIPEDPKFYGTLVCTALLWCVSDVIYFRSVPLAGAICGHAMNFDFFKKILFLSLERGL